MSVTEAAFSALGRAVLGLVLLEPEREYTNWHTVQLADFIVAQVLEQEAISGLTQGEWREAPGQHPANIEFWFSRKNPLKGTVSALVVVSRSTINGAKLGNPDKLIRYVGQCAAEEFASYEVKEGVRLVALH